MIQTPNSVGKMSSSWSFEVDSLAPTAPLFVAAFADWHNLGPKLIPDIITGITILSGNCSPGSIRRINFSPAVPFGFVKERLDSIDREKLEMKITIMEGGDLGKKMKSASSHFKVNPRGSGSTVKWVLTHEVIPGADISGNFQLCKEGFARSIKAVEEYLLTNPHTYA
ncbi:hypothetical protein KSP39_PZI006825 [Platanthera zijinensis]|uniref:Bet v I/Major latex protein domain-containing protein n=1 Tax=Platanthera zijinensis TaxID=2320716 RepID=A0AAP0BPT8_9ASPA